MALANLFLFPWGDPQDFAPLVIIKPSTYKEGDFGLDMAKPYLDPYNHIRTVYIYIYIYMHIYIK